MTLSSISVDQNRERGQIREFVAMEPPPHPSQAGAQPPGSTYPYSPQLSSQPGEGHPPHHPPVYPYPSNPYYTPCKCDYLNQVRYYDHRSKEFYYHTAQQHNVTAGFSGEGESAFNSSYPPPPPPPYFFDPYGPYTPPVGHYPSSYYPPPGGHPGYKHIESGLCELVLVCMALLLWFYSFFRLYRVWQNTLNFNESSIQGPQGWDLLVSWIVERIRIKNLRMPGMSVRRKSLTFRRGGICDPGESVGDVNAEDDRSPPGIDAAERGMASPSASRSHRNSCSPTSSAHVSFLPAIAGRSGTCEVSVNCETVDLGSAMMHASFENEVNPSLSPSVRSPSLILDRESPSVCSPERVQKGRLRPYLNAQEMKQQSLCEPDSSAAAAAELRDNGLRATKSSGTLHTVIVQP